MVSRPAALVQRQHAPRWTSAALGAGAQQVGATRAVPIIPGEKRPLACPAGGRLGVHSQGTGTALEFLSAPETDASKYL